MDSRRGINTHKLLLVNIYYYIMCATKKHFTIFVPLTKIKQLSPFHKYLTPQYDNICTGPLTHDMLYHSNQNSIIDFNIIQSLYPATNFIISTIVSAKINLLSQNQPPLSQITFQQGYTASQWRDRMAPPTNITSVFLRLKLRHYNNVNNSIYSLQWVIYHIAISMMKININSSRLDMMNGLHKDNTDNRNPHQIICPLLQILPCWARTLGYTQSQST